MNIDNYVSIPLGSLVWHLEDEGFYLKIFSAMPSGAKKLITSPASGAYIRGLIKSHQLSSDKIHLLSFIVLQVVSGEIEIQQFAGQLSSKLSLPNDRAQVIAQEIVTDLLDPILSELKEFWAKRDKREPIIEAEDRASKGGASNVLNLKKEQKPPIPPWREQA